MKAFQLVLIKPSHYDDDGYVIRWWRAMTPSNSLAAVYGIATDCAERRVLGADVVIEIQVIDETNTRVDVPALLARFRRHGNFGCVALVGVQSNQYPRALDIARPFRAAGIAVAVKSLRPDVRVVGVQAAGAAAYPPSLAAGRPVSVENPATMADGIKVGRPGDVPFGIIGELVDEVRTVSEDELSAALLLCLERAKLVVEPAGASPVAALLSEPGAFEGPVVAVLSGGNVDPVLMERVLRHGMAAQGRYLAVRLRLTDRPGALATLLGALSVVDANVLDVSHVRTDPRLGLTEAEVELHLETKGPAHCAEVGQALREAGYTVID